VKAKVKGDDGSSRHEFKWTTVHVIFMKSLASLPPRRFCRVFSSASSRDRLKLIVTMRRSASTESETVPDSEPEREAQRQQKRLEKGSRGTAPHRERGLAMNITTPKPFKDSVSVIELSGEPLTAFKATAYLMCLLDDDDMNLEQPLPQKADNVPQADIVTIVDISGGLENLGIYSPSADGVLYKMTVPLHLRTQSKIPFLDTYPCSIAQWSTMLPFGRWMLQNSPFSLKQYLLDPYRTLLVQYILRPERPYLKHRPPKCQHPENLRNPRLIASPTNSQTLSLQQLLLVYLVKSNGQCGNPLCKRCCTSNRAPRSVP